MSTSQSWRIDELEKVVVRALILVQIGLSLGSLMVPIITVSGDRSESFTVGGLVLGLLEMDERRFSGTVLMWCLVVVLLAVLVIVGAMIEVVVTDENSPGTIVAMVAGLTSVVGAILALVTITSLPLRLNARNELYSPDVDAAFPGWGLALAVFAGVWALTVSAAVRKIRS